MKNLALFLLLLALSVNYAAAKKYYKWTDAEGNIHYSDNKPDNVNATKIKAYAGASKLPVKEKEKEKEEKQEGNSSIEEVAKMNEEIDKRNEVIRKNNCKTAKRNLATLQKTMGREVLQKDPKTGNIIKVDKPEQKQLILVNKKAIREFCQ